MGDIMDRELLGLKELCLKHGIELKGDDGQPYHCGKRMVVKGGIIGPDYAKCECGLVIGNVLSPHISGGIPNEAWIRKHGDATWARLDA